MALKAQQQKTRRSANDAGRSLLDSLESRQLMAGYAANINFQPGQGSTPSGYAADTGKSFAWRGGKQMGWNVDNSKNMALTNTSADDLHDSYAKFGGSGQASSWDIAVAKGTYSVKIVAGDANAYAGKYAIKVENTIVTNAAPTSAKRWVEATASVIVADGKLTVSSAAGAVGNKIDSITLTQTSTSTTPNASGASVTPVAPDDLLADATSTSSIALTWGDSSNESSYVVQRSTNGTTFDDVASLGAGTTSYTSNGLSANTIYYFRLKVTNAYGSDIGEAVSARTDANASTNVPDAPEDLKAWDKAGNAVGLDWSTVDGEQGYIIEQSTDGRNFGEVGRVGVNANYFAATNLNDGTKYSWRVKAYNASGTSAASNVATFTNPNDTTTTSPAPTPTPTPSNPSTPANPIDFNSAALTGIVPNVLGVDKAIPVLKALGMKNVRVWYDIISWTGAVKPYMIDEFQKYKNAGFTVTVAFVAKKVPPSAAAAKAQFQKFAASGLKNVVDYWEIGNEMNMPQYWNGSLKQYVTDYLKPAYEALHPVGEKVVGGGLSWDFKLAKELQSYGYSNYCDYAGFHPYGESGAIVVQRARDARANFGYKPLMITEWNVQFVTDTAKWVKEINIAAAGLSKLAVQNYYYSMGVDNSHVGKGGLFYSNGSKNQPFYDAVYNWTH